MKAEVKDIESVLKDLTKELGTLKRTVSEQGSEIDRLNRLDSCHKKDMHEAKRTIKKLESENQELKEKLSKYEKPEKDSHNSSIPPSHESIKAQEIRRTRSLRKKSDRKSGGQKGHTGTTLSTCENPDIIELHKPQFCPECGCPLDESKSELIGKMQVIDLPMPMPQTTEHRFYRNVCACGHHIQCDCPNCRITYGPNIRAFVVYLAHVQCLPFGRICESLRDLFNLSISQGTIQTILKEAGRKAEVPYEKIRQRVCNSRVNGADETGARVGKEHHWNWIFQNPLLTYVFQNKSRGMEAIDEKFPDGLPNSILVTDRHQSYFNMNVSAHQICLAHLLRNVQYLTELDTSQDWSLRFADLLHRAIKLKKYTPFKQITKRKVLLIKNKMTRLLNESLSHLDEEFETFRKGIIKVKDHLFTFLTEEAVPYDNNASEQGVRKIKIKQKISGCFRTDEGADIFAMMHSIAETAKKNNNSKFNAILAVVSQ